VEISKAIYQGKNILAMVLDNRTIPGRIP